jgi:hypothetical protein
MPCEELQVGLEANATPQGSLATDARPYGSGMCRSFDFSLPNIITFAGDNIVTFAGDQMEVF